MASNSTWGSRIGFILASAGSAVGLGAIWKFPYLAGNNGGSVFLLSYLLFTFTVGVAMLISEYVIGREGRNGCDRFLKESGRQALGRVLARSVSLPLLRFFAFTPASAAGVSSI